MPGGEIWFFFVFYLPDRAYALDQVHRSQRTVYARMELQQKSNGKNKTGMGQFGHLLHDGPRVFDAGLLKSPSPHQQQH